MRCGGVVCPHEHRHGGDRGFDGERGRMTQQWDFPVDEPVSLPEWRQRHLAEHLPATAARVLRGETLRAIAPECGLSHEALRRALTRHGYATRPTPTPAASPRRHRIHRLPGRGRSMALSPDEVSTLLRRRRAGESMRSLARSTGVSHETIRRVLASTSQSASA